MSFLSKLLSAAACVALLASPLATASAQQMGGQPGQTPQWQTQPGQVQPGQGQPGQGQPGQGQPGQGQPNGGPVAPGGGQPMMRGDISPAAAATVRGFVAQQGPAAFGPAQPLPPGAVLEIGRPLPPGVVPQPLPPGLVVLMPPPPGFSWVVVGGDIVLMVAATAVIVGVLSGAI